MSSTTTSRVRFEFWRMAIVYAVVAVAFGALLYRLVGLQVFQGREWLADAVNNYTRTISLQAPRGIVYDRNGFILARNIASYNIVITPADLPDADADIQRIYRDLSQLTGVPVNQGTVEDAKNISPCVPGPGIAQLVELGDSLAPYSPVPIQCDVSGDLARVVTEKSVDWPGVSVQIEPIRDYPTGSLTADLIGFLGPIPAALEQQYRDLGFVPNRDKIGYAGVEASLQDILAGKNGQRVVEVDVAGKELRNLEPPVDSIPGDNIKLTIDTRLQAAAQGALVGEIDRWNKYWGYNRISSGVAIAMNPKTGEILAMVSYPTYENNRMARFIPGYYYQQLEQDPRHPLLNNAIQAEYPPGSTFKLSAANGALNEGVVTVNQIINAPGELILTEKFSPNDPGRQRPFVDWIFDQNPAGFGKIDFLHCIAYSSNVCFYKLGGGYKTEIPEGLDIERLVQYAQALGYGKPSGIELLGEQSGLLPTPQWKRINKGENWSTGDTYIATVGQGYVLATPLQVLMSGATMANNGKLMQPTIVRDVTDSEGKVVEKWFNPDDFTITDQRPANAPNAYQISPFIPNMKWDVTTDPIIQDYTCSGGYCTEQLGKTKTIDPYVVQKVREGMRLAVTDTTFGTLNKVFGDFPIAVAGKTGTAEYCDDVALAANRCAFGQWPTHSWTLAFAPYDDPEVVILAFAYNAGEGASVAAPIVGKIMEAYFEIKSIDIAQGLESGK